MDTIKFIQKSKNKHGDTYDYSSVDYKNSYTKVNVLCKYHGSFFVRPKDHLRNGFYKNGYPLASGCPKCGLIRAAKSRSNSTENYLKTIKLIHTEDKFDFSKVNYVHSDVNIIVICKKHNTEFKVTPNNFKNNIYSCPACIKENYRQPELTSEEFIVESVKKHGNKYDYSKTKYTGANEKCIIICKKHGEFEQVASSHKRGFGCPNCSSSRGEMSIKLYLEQNNIKYVQQKSFPGCTHKGLLRFDFYLPDNNTCIEFQGRQHFERVDYFGGEDGFSETKVRDKIKQDFCRSNQINLICITKDDHLDVALRKIK